jgi:hypothetical protein
VKTMKDSRSEEQIKAQLRELTDETRKLRNELNALIRPSKTLASRGFVHERASSKLLPIELAHDRRASTRRRK